SLPISRCRSFTLLRSPPHQTVFRDPHRLAKPGLEATQPFTASARPVILHARCVTGAGGGPEKTILSSPRFLEQMGYECICAYLHPPRDVGFDVLKRRAQVAGARLVGIPDRGPLDLNVISELVKLCRTHQVAIWHGHDYKSNALGLVVQWFWPMKLVTTVHGWVQYTWRTPFYYAIDKCCLRRYDEAICVTEDLYRTCLEVAVSSSH